MKEARGVRMAPSSRQGLGASGRPQERSDGERRFIREVSHALRSPLTVCRWQLELLEDGVAGTVEEIGRVVAELERMEHLLDDLCLLGESAEPGFVRPEPVDLALFVHELVAEAGTVAERDWRLDSAGGTVSGDPHRLREAVDKLVRNAVLHTDRRSTVAIGGSLGDGEARLWVRDTGCALAAGSDAVLSDGFVRGSCPHRGRRDVGMACEVIEAVVAAHGGRVELESSNERGTTIVIVVPA